jgi:hypothetical protein
MKPSGGWFAAFVAVFVLSACQGTARESAPTAPPHPAGVSPASQIPLPVGMPALPAGAAVAYHDRDGIKVLKGRSDAFQASFGAADSGAPSFTADGRHVFARAGKPGSAEGNRLLVFDITTGGVRSVDCPGSAVAAGGSTLVWWEDPDRLMAVDLNESDPKPKTLRTVQLPATPAPPGAWGGHSPRPGGTSVLGADADTVIIGTLPMDILPTGGPTYLFAVGRNGAVHSVGPAQSDGQVSRVWFSPDGKRIAYVGASRVSPSSRSSFPVLVDMSTWQMQVSRIQEPTDPNVVPGVGGLWWDADGSLDAVYTATRNDSPGPKASFVTPPNVWTLGDQAWKQIGFGGERWIYHLASNAVVTLGPDPEHSDLVVESQGRRGAISEGVTDVAAFPAVIA